MLKLLIIMRALGRVFGENSWRQVQRLGSPISNRIIVSSRIKHPQNHLSQTFINNLKMLSGATG